MDEGGDIVRIEYLRCEVFLVDLNISERCHRVVQIKVIYFRSVVLCPFGSVRDDTVNENTCVQ